MFHVKHKGACRVEKLGNNVIFYYKNVLQPDFVII